MLKKYPTTKLNSHDQSPKQISVSLFPTEPPHSLFPLPFSSSTSLLYLDERYTERELNPQIKYRTLFPPKNFNFI